MNQHDPTLAERGAANAHPPRRILVIKSRHLGDVLLTGPLISTLKQTFPDSSLSALVKPECGPILEGHPHLDEVLTVPKRRDGESLAAFSMRQLVWWWDLRRQHFNWTINATEGDRGIIAGFLCGATERTGFLRSKNERWWRKLLLTEAVQQEGGRRHFIMRNLAVLAGHALHETTYTKVHMTFPAEDAQAVDTLLRTRGWDGKRPLVHVHPVARWLFKCWTDEGMAHVIDHLQEKGFAVGITSSIVPDEMAKIEKILALCRTSPINLAGRLTIKQVAAFSARCRFFFGVDTAIMHMAASMDVPVFALFGPTKVFEWGPWPNGWSGNGGTPYPLQNGVQKAGPHVAIQKDDSCVPCGKDGCEGSKISDCLVRLDHREIMPELDRFIDLSVPGRRGMESVTPPS